MLRPEQRVFLRNEAVQHVYVVTTGALTLEARLCDQRRVLELFYPGDIFATADAPLLPDTALVAGVASELSRFRDWRHDGSTDGVPVSWFQAIACRNTRRMLHLASLSETDAEGRLADLLVEAALFIARGGEFASAFLLPFSREQMASYLALNPDTVSRLFTRLKSRGLIAVRHGRIEILDWPGLCVASPVSSTLLELARRRPRSSPPSACG